MAPREKTVTHPDKNLDDIINQPILKMVVVIDDQDLVNIANDLALDAPMNVDRWVVWYKKPDVGAIKQIIKNLPEELNNIKAFSLSTVNKVSDIIYKNEIADYVRVEIAYTKAGLPENNQ